MAHTAFTWQTSDRLQLFAQVWQPEVEPRGVVCLVHGLGEHSGRYAHVGAALTQARYALLGFDLRGHGKSEGQRGHAPSWDDLLDDVARLLDEAAQRFPDCPRFLYGHSLGGTLVLTYALRRRPQLAGVIASGSLLRPAFTPPAWKVSLGRLMYRVRPTFSMHNEVDPQRISRDAQVVRAYVNDPLVYDRLSARLGMDMLWCGEWALEHAAQFTLPLLVLHGSADALCSPEANRQFADHVTCDCTYSPLAGLYHEVHNEPEQKEVFDTMIAWLEAHTPT